MPWRAGTRTTFSAIATPLAIGITTLFAFWPGYGSNFLVVTVTMAGAVIMVATVKIAAAEAQVQAADEVERSTNLRSQSIAADQLVAQHASRVSVEISLVTALTRYREQE
jgi:hypothetical protein